MRRSGRHATLALLALVAGGCGNSDSPPNQPSPGLGGLIGGGVQVTTDQASYQDGAPVVLAIHNREAEPVAYNACTRKIEIRVGVGWVPGPESLRLCSREVTYVDAGATRVDSTNLDLGLSPGKYRIVISFSKDGAAEGEPILAATNPFTIDP